MPAEDAAAAPAASAAPAAAAAPAGPAPPLSPDPDDWEGNLDDEDGGSDEVDGSNEDEADEGGGEDDDAAAPTPAAEGGGRRGRRRRRGRQRRRGGSDDEEDDDEEGGGDEDEEDEDEDEGADEPGEGSNGEDAVDDNAGGEDNAARQDSSGDSGSDSGSDSARTTPRTTPRDRTRTTGSDPDLGGGSNDGERRRELGGAGSRPGRGARRAGRLSGRRRHEAARSRRGWPPRREKRGLPPELPVMASLVESGLRNLSYGDADSVGFFQMRTSIWDQGAYAGYSDHPALQLRWFLDHAEAVKEKRVAAGLPVDDPHSYGDWIADVERPAEQFRGRYQLRLDEAQSLLGGGRRERSAHAVAGRRGAGAPSGRSRRLRA